MPDPNPADYPANPIPWREAFTGEVLTEAGLRAALDDLFTAASRPSRHRHLIGTNERDAALHATKAGTGPMWVRCADCFETFDATGPL